MFSFCAKTWATQSPGFWLPSTVDHLGQELSTTASDRPKTEEGNLIDGNCVEAWWTH